MSSGPSPTPRSGIRCSGCNRVLDVGDRYIEDDASAFMGTEADPFMDGLMADLLGGGGKIVYCEDCTQDGGQWKLNTVYGDEGDDA